jgi:glycosyltransferase involved in cell wall biosynthesis
MRVLILAAGRFGGEFAQRIAEGEEPRLDVFELRDALRGEILDYRALDAAPAQVRAVRRALGDGAALALLGVQHRPAADAFFTTGEDVGIPLSALLKAGFSRASHTMIAHTLAPAKKRPFFTLLRLQTRMDRILCYSSNEERFIVEKLGIRAPKLRRIHYHADQHFFRPRPEVPLERDLLCSAGQLLRDYDTLVEAVRDLPVRLRIAAGSPWIDSELRPRTALPHNVDWRRYERNELRDLYARSALAVVPILQNDYQTGVSTILEMMAMGKCVIATRTRGQSDVILDGENGVYVRPGDVAGMRQTIERLLANPEEARRIGAAARRFIEEEAHLDLFTHRLAEAVREATAARNAG